MLDIKFRRTTLLKTKTDAFKSQYGTHPDILAEVWFDVQQGDLDESDQSEAGFKSFLMANYFLWTYPKNSRVLGQSFGICERYSRGNPIWRWVAKIRGLKASKIVWPERLDSPDTEIFVISVDGKDFKIWEKKHPFFNQDRKMCSHKFRRAGFRYEIGISIFESKVVWIAGPFRCGKADISIYKGVEDEDDARLRLELGRPEYECLEDKLVEGKLAVGDRAYGSARNTAVKENTDPKALHNFKSRALSRHEAFNGRLWNFSILKDCFRHPFRKHPVAVEAICVLLQYQMDGGDELFAV